MARMACVHPDADWRLSTDGTRLYCLACMRERTREWRQRTRPHLRTKYGISAQEYDALLTEQGHACACCFEPFGSTTPQVDHDHRTNRVRGLLCGPCNTMLGCSLDNPDRLRAGAAFLEAHALAQRDTP